MSLFSLLPFQPRFFCLNSHNRCLAACFGCSVNLRLSPCLVPGLSTPAVSSRAAGLLLTALIPVSASVPVRRQTAGRCPATAASTASSCACANRPSSAVLILGVQNWCVLSTKAFHPKKRDLG